MIVFIETRIRLGRVAIKLVTDQNVLARVLDERTLLVLVVNLIMNQPCRVGRNRV